MLSLLLVVVVVAVVAAAAAAAVAVVVEIDGSAFDGWLVNGSFVRLARWFVVVVVGWSFVRVQIYNCDRDFEAFCLYSEALFTSPCNSSGGVWIPEQCATVRASIFKHSLSVLTNATTCTQHSRTQPPPAPTVCDAHTGSPTTHSAIKENRKNACVRACVCMYC